MFTPASTLDPYKEIILVKAHSIRDGRPLIPMPQVIMIPAVIS